MKKFAACLIIAMMMVGTAWAYDEAYHVKEAPNGIGDLIVFPGYLALGGGWETKYTVVNTDPVYSVVAKVVVRSHYWTDELLDFLIYLSPRDVWTGYLKNDGNGVYLYSEDDSILVSSNTFASPENPVRQPLFTQGMCSGDFAELGYLEVIETWYGDSTQYSSLNPGGTTYDITPPVVDKPFLLLLYPPDQAGQAAGWVDTTPTATSDGVDHTVNVLTGWMEIQNNTMAGMNSMMRGKIYADFDITQYLKVIEVSGLNAYVGQNLLGELEAAMSKNAVAMPYYNTASAVSIHFFNFPTKLGWTSTCTYTPTGPFWQQYGAPTQCITYTAPFFDLKENLIQGSSLFSGGTGAAAMTMCEELHMLPTNYSGLFEEGWVEYNFAANDPTTFDTVRGDDGDDDDFSYYGIPVIPYFLNIDNGLALAHGSADDGTVYATDTATPEAGTWLPEYQYWNYIADMGIHTTAAGYPFSANAGWADIDADGVVDFTPGTVVWPQ